MSLKADVKMLKESASSLPPPCIIFMVSAAKPNAPQGVRSTLAGDWSPNKKEMVRMAKKAHRKTHGLKKSDNFKIIVISEGKPDEHIMARETAKREELFQPSKPLETHISEPSFDSEAFENKKLGIIPTSRINPN